MGATTTKIATANRDDVVRHTSSRVSIIEKPDELKVVYRWQEPGNAIPKLVFWAIATAFVSQLFAGVIVVGDVGVPDWNAIHHPGLIIIASFLLYLGAVCTFNKTTTTITGTLVKTRRGPLLCLWPGNHKADINEVREICYARRFPASNNSESTYCVFVTFTNGVQVMLFTMAEHERFILIHARQIQEFINKKQLESGKSSSKVKRKVIKSSTIPPTNIQKLRIIITIVCLSFALITVALSAEKFTAQLRSRSTAQQSLQH